MSDEAAERPGDLQHPAYVLESARPGEVMLAPESHRRSATVDDEGWFDVPDDLNADRIRDRLATTYDVEYADDGSVLSGGSAGDGAESDAEADANGADTADSGADDATEADVDESPGEYSREDLEEMDVDELREVFDEVGGDRDAVDMRKPNEIVAGILRAQADAEQEG